MPATNTSQSLSVSPPALWPWILPATFAAGMLVMAGVLWVLQMQGWMVDGTALSPGEAPGISDGERDDASIGTQPALSRGSPSTATLAPEPSLPGSLTSGGLPIALQNELDFLREEIEAGRQRLDALEAVAERSARAAPAATDAPTDAADAIGGASSQDPADRPQREYDRLVAAGIDSQTAELLQQRVDEQALARLELTDQASREGWRDSGVFAERIEALNEQAVDLREELGEQAYDRYLFTAGRNNRVSIGSVIGGSAADLAGLSAGDLLLSYADRRVFRLRELQEATRNGERGEIVQLQVMRNGSEVIISVPRGPLGVTLEPQRVDP